MYYKQRTLNGEARVPILEWLPSGQIINEYQLFIFIWSVE